MLSKYLENLVKDEDGLKIVSMICDNLCDYLDNPTATPEDALDGLISEDFLIDPEKDNRLLWLCFRELTSPEKANKCGTTVAWFDDWFKRARSFTGRPTKDLFTLLAEKQAVLYSQKKKPIFDRVIDAAERLYKYAESSALQGRFSKIVESCRAVDENYRNQKV